MNRATPGDIIDRESMVRFFISSIRYHYVLKNLRNRITITGIYIMSRVDRTTVQLRVMADSVFPAEF